MLENPSLVDVNLEHMSELIYPSWSGMSMPLSLHQGFIPGSLVLYDELLPTHLPNQAHLIDSYSEPNRSRKHNDTNPMKIALGPLNMRIIKNNNNNNNNNKNSFSLLCLHWTHKWIHWFCNQTPITHFSGEFIEP